MQQASIAPSAGPRPPGPARPTTPRPGRPNPLLRAGSRFALLLLRPWLLRRVRRPVVERIDGVPLLVLPQVLNPVVFRSGALLARTVATSPLAAPPPAPGTTPLPRALDMGTGSGVGAIFAARRGYRVVAVDVNPEAVRCARINALLNGVEDRMEARLGDLFAPVAGERFDLVLFNPPFFRGSPADPLDAAWRSTDVPERFAAGLGDVLAPGGRALVLLSTDGDAAGVLCALTAAGLEVSPGPERHYGNEIMTVYRVVPPPPDGPTSPEAAR